MLLYRSVLSFSSLALMPTLWACGSSSTTTPDAPGRIERIEMPSVSLAPSQETTLCVTLQLSNATPQLLRRVHSVIAPGSHHLIAYRMPAGTAVAPTPTPCEPFTDIL